MPPKKTKQEKKVLGQAALQRLELERQEAAKSKTEKLAECIKKRSTIAGKHSSVVRQINMVQERNLSTKKVKVTPIKKVHQVAPMQRNTELDIFNFRIAARDQQFQRLFKQAETIRHRIAKITNREQAKLAEALRDCYGIYEFVENSQDGTHFYENLRSYFKVVSEKIQSNTPDEGLLVRFIFSNKSTKQISEYATVIRYAREIRIAKKDFVKWYTDTTQTRILEKARQSDTSGYADKLTRAKIALLRYFDIQEQWPLGHFDYPEMLATKQVHLPNDLIFVICRGVRKFNRDVMCDPNQPHKTRVPLAEISALHFIPPQLDIVHDMIHRLAKFLVPYIEQIEQELEEKTEQVWAHDLTHLLMERELGAAYKAADFWAAQMQASLASDQKTFVEQQRKIQKIRKQERGFTAPAVAQDYQPNTESEEFLQE